MVFLLPGEQIYQFNYNTIHMYFGITNGRVLNGELLCTKILEVNLFAFATSCFIEISLQSTGHFAFCNLIIFNI